ncbi:MAG: ATP-grasp domain-containing protein [Gaiellaceae bacterium]
MLARVLLLVDESPGGLAAVRALHRAGYETYVGVAQEGTPAARSRYAAEVFRLPDPFADPAAYVAAVAEAVTRREIAAVLPGMESSLRALTGREEAFGADVVVGTNPLESLERATDKLGLEALAAAAGLRAPRTVELGADATDADLEGVRFPAVVKPIRSVEVRDDGSLTIDGVTVVDDAPALRAQLARARAGRWLVQPYVEGRLAAVCGVAWEGRLLTACHQLSPRIWPPGKGISAFAVTTAPSVERQAGVARMLAQLGWSGVYGVQFLLAGDGDYVIDLNPRIYGSLALAVAAGHNLPGIWADLLLGRRPVLRPYRVGVGYRVELADVRAAVHARDLRGLLPRRRTSHALFSLRDPLPVLAIADELLSRLRR